MEIIHPRNDPNKTLVCYTPDDCGYKIGYHGLSYDGTLSPEAREIRDRLEASYPAADFNDFFWAMMRGERDAAKEQDAIIMRKCNARKQ